MSTTEKVAIPVDALKDVLTSVLTEARKPVVTDEQVAAEQARKAQREEQERINEQIRKNKEFEQKYCNHMQNNGKDTGKTSFTRVFINDRPLLHCQRCQVQTWPGEELYMRFFSMTE